MDQFRTPACALDSTNDLRVTHCNSQCKFYPSGYLYSVFFFFFFDSMQYSIYMATIDYMVAAYGPYSASATGGNALARDFLAGIAAMYSTPSKPFPLPFVEFSMLTNTVYENMGHSNPLEWASTLLGFLAIGFIIPIYIFYWNGPKIREKSKFAQVLASDRKKAQRRVSQCGSGEPGPEEHYFSGSGAV